MTDERGELRLRAAAEIYCNWGKWGAEDQIGTLNYITPDEVVRASQLVRRGRIFSLSIAFDETGPQSGAFRRFNPMHLMLRDGDDAFAPDRPGVARGQGGSDDIVILATHGATHWDALAHIFFDDKMWNGYDCRLVSATGAKKNDISTYRDRIVGRAVLLDLPRHFGVDWCALGQAVTSDDLVACAANQGVEIRRGDIVLLRFGHLAMCRARGSWDSYAGGDAPGLSFDTVRWIFESEIAGVAADTWGVEVRPNEITYTLQPWHRVAIARIGLLVGEMFDLDQLATDCAEDGVYEAFLSASPCPVTGSVGGPINPTAVK